MSMQYVRDTYGVPVGLHKLVKPVDGGGVLSVTSCTHLVHARPVYGNVRPVRRYHPLDLKYKTEYGWFRP